MGLKLFLYRIEENGNYKLIQSNPDFSFFKMGAFIYAKDMNVNSNGYLLIGVPSDASYNGDFFVEIESSPGGLSAFIKDFLLYDKDERLDTGGRSNNSQKKSTRKVIKKTSIIRKTYT